MVGVEDGHVIAAVCFGAVVDALFLIDLHELLEGEARPTTSE